MSRYVAKAVTFAGATYLSIGALTSNDNQKFSLSFWFRHQIPQPVGRNSPTVFVTDPAGNHNCHAQLGSGAFGPAVGDVFFTVHLDNVPVTNITAASNTVSFVGDTRWHHILYSFDASLPNQVSQLYVDGIRQGNVNTQSGTDAFPGQMMNGKSCFVGGSNVPAFDDLFCDLADVWIAPGVSLIDPVTGLISDANRLLFTDNGGRPKDPAGFPASAILFSGDDIGFQVNQGTGGVFVLNGPLTNATTSPSNDPIGFLWPIRLTWTGCDGPTADTGFSDCQSNFAYVYNTEGATGDIVAGKYDRFTNTLVQSARIPFAAAPALPGMTVIAGICAPWSDLSRMFCVSNFDQSGIGNGPWDWYVTSLDRKTLLPTSTVKVVANGTTTPTGPFNDYNQVSCSADGLYVVFCNNSPALNPNESSVAIFNTRTQAFAVTTATSLGITTDAFQSLVIDADNFLYCGSLSARVYKLKFDPVTLVASLVATFDLRGQLPTPNGAWAVYSVTYRKFNKTLLVWMYDSGGAPLSSRMVEINPLGQSLGPPLVFPDGAVAPFSYPSFGQLCLPPIAHWTSRNQFVGATFGSAPVRTTFYLIDVDSKTVKPYPDSLWTSTDVRDFISPGLIDFDPSVPSIWTNSAEITIVQSSNPPAQLLFPPLVLPGQAKLPITPPEPYRPLHSA